MSFTQPSLKGRALRLLSGREYSRAELERKLKTHEETSGELVRALDELQAKGFISEQRVVESVINRRSAKLGTARIRQELQGKGLDPQAVTDAVASLKATELARAQRGCGARSLVPNQTTRQTVWSPMPQNAANRCVSWPRAALAAT